MATKFPKDGHLELVSQPPRPTKPPRPSVISRIEEDTLKISQRLIEHMFSAIDDLFYELSKRASSNNEENLYFESMRELRIKKGQLISQFLDSIKDRFIELNHPSAAGAHTASEPETELSIVAGDDLEIDIAKKGMASRTREMFKTDLYELCVRLDHLLLQTSVSEANNPVDPTHISGAFIEACQNTVQLHIKARLILFKIFEKHVLKQLGHIYSDINSLLIETGILPKVPKHLQGNPRAEMPESKSKLEQITAKSNREDPSQPETDTRADEQAETSVNNVVLDEPTLATIMAAIRTSLTSAFSMSGVGGNVTNNNYYFYGKNPGPVMSKPVLSENLNLKQPEVDRTLSRANTPKNLLPEIINELLKAANPEAPSALAQHEEDVINLVARFFDMVLEDPELPVAVQSCLCRLQIPILKVALNDITILTNDEHPARKLVNAITQIGLSLDTSKPVEKDPLYCKVLEVIDTINKRYKLDISVFSEALREFEKFVSRESVKSNVVERRTTQTEEGKVKIKHARQYAQSTLYDKMKESQIHPQISHFLTEHWLQVLVITNIKEGSDSNACIENEQLVTDLIWLSQHHKDEKSLARAHRLIPDILERIDQGLTQTIVNPQARNDAIGQLEQALSELVNPATAAKIHFQSLSNAQRESLGRADSDEKTWEEMTALERQQSRYEELSNEFYEKAKDLPVGSWVRYLDDDSKKIVHCKLSAKIDAETYIFVSRLGFKALEKTRRQFAYDMQFNKAQVLDRTPLFDKILQNIIGQAPRAA